MKLDRKRYAIWNLAARFPGLLAVPAILLGLSVIPAAADDSGCSNATLRGDYGYAVAGVSVTVPPIGSVAVLGRITLDGKGTFSGSANGSIVGNVLTDMAITGTYSIASDCTGTLTTAYPAFTAHFSLVVVDGVDGRKEAKLLETDAGTVATGTLSPANHCRD
jgi:hypothetical protein